MGNYMNVVANNIPGMFSQRQLGVVRLDKSKSAEKLSSGYKINRAADDAAGLTISENMRRMIRGLTQASANVEDGVSLCQIADGYLDEVHDMLHRCTELSVKASNGTLTNADREAINDEVNALKKEMKRIFSVANFNEIPLFHVPYTPEISTPPNDMELFHVGNGDVGGLEFNNVRYNISELQGKGLKIDSNGVATEDFEVSFDLWDGETVDISMKAGDGLDKAKRNYKWTVDENGFSINNKLAAEWKEVTGPDGKPVTDTSIFPVGTYSFTHHGMTISFDIDEEGDFEDMKTGINGDAATKPASWDVSVGGSVTKDAVKIDNAGSQQIDVTNANKDYIDHTYVLLANEDGIAIKDRNTSYTTSYTAWNTFSDPTLSNLTDENGNPVATNNGYPILNWGTENDANTEAQITFDESARYLYKANDSNIPAFVFNFKLAESASLEEVESALNNRVFSTSKVMAGGNFSVTGNNGGIFGTLSVGSGSSFAVDINNDNRSGDFALQRAYGRNFDTNESLSAEIRISRTALGTDPGQDVPVGSGGYSTGGHTLDRRLNSTTNPDVTSRYDQTYSYYYTIERYDDYVYDENGQMIQKTDGNGNPVTDGDGNPVYETEEKTRNHYYKYTSYKENSVKEETWSVKDRWTRNADYTFSGSLNGNNMDDVTKSQTETYERTLTQKRTETTVRYTNNVNLGEVSEDSLSNEEKEQAVYASSTYALPQYSFTLGSPSYSDYSTTNIGNAQLVSVGTTSFSMDFTSDKGKAFSFNYDINLDQAKRIAGSSVPSVKIGTISFNPHGTAYRSFRPAPYGTISEAEFSDVKLNVPKKQLDIQAGADGDDIIRMEWSPLNLTIIGISGANTLTQDSARAAIGMVQKALDIISETRSTFGAYQNRFEHTIRNLDNIVENTQAAESQIRDTDMAKEMVRYAKDSILEQAGTSMLVQSNQSKDWIIRLLNQ